MKLSFTKIFYLDFLRRTRLSIGEPPGCLGGPQSLKTAKTSYKSSDIPLSTIHASKAQLKSSHSGIIHLNFSWHTRLSIGNHWGPWGAIWGPFRAWKRLKYASNHPIFIWSCFVWETPSLPIVNFLWHTRLSIESHWGPLWALEGALRARKRIKNASNHQIFFGPPSTIQGSLIVPKGRPSVPL